MRITEVVLALVLGAVLFSMTKMLSVATSFQTVVPASDSSANAPPGTSGGPPGSAASDGAHAPPAGSIAARLWAEPSTETILRQEIAVLEKQREVLRLSVEELKLSHERSARVKAIGIAQDMIRQRETTMAAAAEAAASSSSSPPPAAAAPTTTATSATAPQRTMLNQRLARSAPPAAPAPNPNNPAAWQAAAPPKAAPATVQWCEQAAKIFGLTGPVMPLQQWGGMKDDVYRSAWLTNNCDTIVGFGTTPPPQQRHVVASLSPQVSPPPPPQQQQQQQQQQMQMQLAVATASPPGGAFQYLKHDGVDGQPRRKVTVVVWNKIRGFLDWLRADFVKDARTKCSTECIFTEAKGQLGNAQGVLFHAKTHNMADFPRSKGNPSQKYMMVSLEQPAYAPLMKKPAYLKKFDYTMTYDLDTSAVPIITIHPHYAAREYFDAPVVPFHKKRDAAVMFTSNCKNAGAENRLKYYEELMKHMEVHSYGKCLHNKDEPDAQGRNRNENKRHILSQYKWYLAFENNVIKDYVSEKVFDGILAGTVPVYYGTDTVDRLLPAPGKTVVKVSDFSSPAALAAHLKAVGADQAKYEAMLSWKQNPPQHHVDKFQEVIDSTGYKYTSLCRICHRLATDIPE